MLSYIHSFHAGNSADVHKHMIISLVIGYLCKKDKPFTVIDAHSGSGIYNLKDESAEKTGESSDGILRLLSAGNISEELKNLSYIRLAEKYAENFLYPGSPELCRSLMRAGDELILNELHPKIITELKSNLHSKNTADAPKISVHNRNAYEFLPASVPPKIRRGCAIIDPSYEDISDYTDTAETTGKCLSKWQNGIYIIWYPLLDRKLSELENMKQSLTFYAQKYTQEQENAIFFSEIKTKDPAKLQGLSKMYGSGMCIINPPYSLPEKINVLTAELESLLRLS